MHIAEIIITLLLALAFILLGLFNPTHMDIDLFGLKSLSFPPALLTFSFFLLGAAYVAFWTLFDRFRKQLVINRLNGRVKELEEKLINEEKLMNKEQSPEGNPCEQGSPSPDVEIDVTEDETAGAVSPPREQCGTASQPQEAETINCTEEAK